MATKKVKRHHASLPILPQDLVIGILSRLPAKSLVRFKCVSKSWRNLFIQPHFVKMHLSQSKERRLIFSCGSLDLNFRRELLIQSDNDLRTMQIVPPFTEEQVWIFGSCNGLLLLETHVCNTLYVVNISTRELNRILGLPFRFIPIVVSYGFGYDAFRDDYKVVAISSPMTSLYKLKTKSWRKIQDFPLEYTPSEPGLLLNGVLHWFSWQVSRMTSFDLVEEKFREVPLPVDLQSRQCEGYPPIGDYKCHAIGVVGGCLCISITDLWMHSSEFWVMKEYGKRESWTNLGIIIPYNLYAKSLDFTNNDKNLFLIDESRLLVYNLKEKICRYPEIFNMFHKWFGAETYLESIVSPKYHNAV